MMPPKCHLTKLVASAGELFTQVPRREILQTSPVRGSRKFTPGVLPGASVLLLQSHVRAGPAPNITHIDGPARFAFKLRFNRLRPSTLTLDFVETVRALRGEGAEESKVASYQYLTGSAATFLVRILPDRSLIRDCLL